MIQELCYRNAGVQLTLDASILELNVRVGKFFYTSSKNLVKWIQF